MEHNKTITMSATTHSLHEYSSVYPGVYVAPPRRNIKLIDIKDIEWQVSRSPFNICELADHYSIEMPAPGFHREDFVISATGKTMLVTALKNRNALASAPEEKRYLSHHFVCDRIKQNIELPPDSDTAFVSAEYSNGILKIRVYKSGYHEKESKSKIIVY
jgi:HSP20 family molecular chaperone IbpA